jgi:hypothetical protein
MLRQAVERCPDDLWLAGEHPRNFWRIAYHACFYTHLYLAQNEAAFTRWEKHRDCAGLWSDGVWDEAPQQPFSQAETIEYIDLLMRNLDSALDALDLDHPETGFDWYPNMSKLSHQIMNIRHLQGHVGQLSELLMARGVEIDWNRGTPKAGEPAA